MNSMKDILSKLRWDGLSQGAIGLAAIILGILQFTPILPITKDPIVGMILAVVGILLSSSVAETYRHRETETRLRAQIEQAKQEFLEANHLSAILSDQTLGQAMQDLAKSYARIKKFDFLEYNDLARSSLRDCVVRFHEIASGVVRLPAGLIQEYGFTLFKEVKKTVQVTHSHDMDYWKTEFGRRHFGANLIAIRNNVSITRIFALTEMEAKQHIDILKEHQAAGIQVLILPPERITEDFLIFDGKILIQYEKYETNARVNKAEYLILDEDKVSQAREDFERLARHPYALTIADLVGEN